ncbi:MAG: hypothetical protein IKU54_01550 [Oscillospiraceae bacterium]|nr:hypothetical protein [Oscillospiraceae bacterium]
MKRFIAGVLASAMALSLTACGTDTTRSGKWDYKTGLATYTRTGNSYGGARTADDKVTSTIVAAVFDKNGKIVKVSIDEVESRPGITGEFVSKKEMGDNYGMKAVSGIGKEWYEQVNGLEKWLEGKDISRLTSTVTGKMRQYADNSVNYGNTDTYTKANSAPDSTANSANNVNSGGMMDSSGVIGDIAGDVMDGVNDVIDGMTDGGQNNTGIASGMWADEDLRAMVTIDTTNIQRAVEMAWQNAK